MASWLARAWARGLRVAEAPVNALIQFSVTNFRSFGGTAALSMEAPAAVDEAFVRVVPGHAALRLLPLAALFGANASGKSNLLRALEAVRRLVVGQPLKSVIDPFRLTRAGREAPTGFQMDAVVDGTRVTYVLACTRDAVCAEALYATEAGGAEEVVFERDAEAEPRVELGPRLGAADSVQRQFFALNAEGTPRDQLMLRDLAERSRDTPHRVALLEHLCRWMGEGLVSVGPSSPGPRLADLVDNPTVTAALGDALSRYDTGVRRLRFLPRALSPFESLMAEVSPRGYYLRSKQPDGSVEASELVAEHVGGEAEGPPLQFVDESDGTRRLLNLLPLLRPQPEGQCVLVDELDRSLHAAAAQQFVRDFLASRPTDQLIFSTHDISLLDMPELPPASVWFVEKDGAGCSNLHALSEVKPAQLERLAGHFSAAYLQGRFGGVPHLRPDAAGE